MYDFTQYAPYQGMGPGMFANPAPDPAAAQPKPKAGMFGGNAGNIIAAALAGYTARSNPVPQQAMFQMMQAKQQQAMEQQQYEQRRQQALKDQMSLIDYRSTHAQPDDFTQRVMALNGIKPGLGDTYAQNYANNGGAAFMPYTDPATGQHYLMPRPQAPQPLSDDDILKMSGGQTPGASGGFL